MQPGLGDVIVTNYLPPNLSLEEIGPAFDERVDKLWTLFWAEQGPTLDLTEYVCNPASHQTFSKLANFQDPAALITPTTKRPGMSLTGGTCMAAHAEAFLC